MGGKLAKDITPPEPLLAQLIESRLPIHPPTFEFKELTLIDIATLVIDLTPSTSCGVDGLNARLLKMPDQ